MKQFRSLFGILLLAVFGLAGCSTTGPEPSVTRASTLSQSVSVLAIGDSLMSWNTIAGKSIPQKLSGFLGQTVVSKAVPGAKMMLRRPTLIGMSIPKQFTGGRWDTVVMSGGGNDIWQNCACGPCQRTLNNLISTDGKSGRIPKLVQDSLLPSADHVIYVGYLRSPGVASLTDGCADEGAVLEARLQRLDNSLERFHFISVADLVPEGDRSFHSLDGVHPSQRGSDEIARRIAQKIFEIRGSELRLASN